MKAVRFFFFVGCCFVFTIASAQKKNYAIHTVAFYNFENFFDTINDPYTTDDEWTPKGAQHWTSKKYQEKVRNLARVLLEIGTGANPNAPTLVGCSEIENRGVLEDLVADSNISHKEYGIVHFDSPDKRGIDVALLYQKKYFRPTSYSNIPLYVYKEKSTVLPKTTEPNPSDEEDREATDYANRIFTRDQLLVTGFLEQEEIHIIVNHWPSRSGGEKATSRYREAAATLNRKIIDSLQQINPLAKVITLGDLNDGPLNNSIKIALGAKAIKEEVPSLGVFNPFEALLKKGYGTIAYRDSWDIFDQIMVTQSLINQDFTGFQYWKAGIYNKPFLIQTEGQYKGYPKRHSANEVGYSDHFPVYLYLIKEIH